MLVQILVTEKRKAFYHFITTLCAIVGGVFTVAGIVDGLLHQSVQLAKKIDLGKQARGTCAPADTSVLASYTDLWIGGIQYPQILATAWSAPLRVLHIFPLNFTRSASESI